MRWGWEDSRDFMSSRLTARARPLSSRQCGRAFLQTQVRSFSQTDVEEGVAEL